jgi:outer membrane protein
LAAGLLVTPAAVRAQGLDLDAAPVGKSADTFMVRLRAIGVIPQNWNSNTTIGGTVSATSQAAPELDVSYFFTDNIAAELIAASTRHDVAANNTVLGHVDVGSTWVLPPTVTLQYHFQPKERFSPYVGAGLNATWFYASHPALPTVTKATFSNNVGFALQAGFDYNVSGHWFMNFDVKQLFLNTDARLSTLAGPVKAFTSLSPTVIGAGIGYRF